MAGGEGQQLQRKTQAEQCGGEVDPAIWAACAGKSFHVPAVGSRVYYFPQGHMEHCSDPESALSMVSHLPPTPFFTCRVLQAQHLVDPGSEEVFARLRLEPCVEGRPLPEGGPHEEEEVVSFAKILTPSDANNGGGFSVPRFCADSIFPPLDFAADPPVQTLSVTDLRGQTWKFRHIYRGTPRRHLLTTGWSRYVNSKKLIAGDSVVFMRKGEGELFLGVRRAKKSVSSAEVTRWLMAYGGVKAAALPRKKKEKVPPESVAQALQLAAENVPFEAVYYPRPGSRDFVVEADRVDKAVSVPWAAGTRVKIGVEAEDSSRMTLLQGTVTAVSRPDPPTLQVSPWGMLQVAWDEPDAILEKMENINPWQVERVSQMALNDTALPSSKRLRLLTESETDYPLAHMGLSNSMIENHLSSSYSTNYSIIPAGMQGARQCTRSLPNLANVGSGTRQLLATGQAEYNLQRSAVMSNNLNVGASQSDVSPEPHSASTILSSRPDATFLPSRALAPNVGNTKIRLFGSTISRQEVANKENQEFGKSTE